MDIVTTNKDFPDQLKEMYKDRTLETKKTGKEVIDFINKEYGITLISNLDELDAIGKSKIDELKFLLQNKDDICIKEFQFEIFRLDKGILTDKFYLYYHDRYQDGLIYVYHESQTDKLFSNCSLLELKLLILSGLEKSDVENETREYFSYLNTCYHYERILNSL